jgi:hypothetical protein
VARATVTPGKTTSVATPLADPELESRADPAEGAIALVRAEGLEPGLAEVIGRRWARGELDTDALDLAVRRIAAGEPLDDLLG